GRLSHFFQIFVEVERARLVLMLAEMKEAEGKIDEAATILQEVQSLQCYILFLLLAPFDDEAKQLAQTVQTMEAKKLKEIPVFA
ncbi:putative 26s proteasome subunit p55, partial [Toxoplasma gondii MAS]